MNYAAIKNCDIANGPGVRVSLFVSGCRHHCKDCFNPETWDFACGEPFDEAVMDKLLALLAPGYIRGITYLGGEPFEPENQPGLLDLREHPYTILRHLTPHISGRAYATMPVPVATE